MGEEITLFDSAEEAWFWFMQANGARQDGARIAANLGLYKRPCEPSDILKILERLRRHRRLDMHHFRVMRHYGDRMIAPEPDRPREAIAARLWAEAMDILNDVLIAKDIVRPNLSAEIIHFQSRREAMQQW
jgi:hypothetical protein